MFALDLFNNDHERRLAEGAVDQLEQRRIDDLAMKMDDLVARAKQANTPEAKAALVKEFQKCKAERDSYFKIKEPQPSGVYKKNEFNIKEPQDECMGYGGLGEAGIGQDVVNKTEKMARATPSTPTSKVASTVKNAAKWLAGKGGPGKEGPTYEGQDQKKNSEVNESQHLSIGDPIIVTAPNEFEGKTGEIADLSPSGKFIIVNLYNHGEQPMHLSDVEYNQYADDQEEDDWYDDKLNEFAPSPERDDDEVPDQILKLANRWWNATDDQPKIANVLRSLGWSIAQVESEDDAVQLQHNDGTVVFISADDFDPDVFEGWSDAVVARRTGQPRTPYSVYIKGKKWKDFENDDHAEAVANKLRAKFKADGRDPSVITIAATDYDKDIKEEGSNEFKPVGPITIIPPKKLKSGETYQDRNKYWQSQGQAPIYKTNEEGKGTPVPAKDFVKGVLKDLKKVNVKEAEGRVDPILIKALNNMPDGLATHREVLDAAYDAYTMEVGKIHIKQNYGVTHAYIPKLMGLYKDKHGLTFNEAETDYSKRRARERDVDAGKPVAKQRQPRMTDYQKKRAQDRKDMELGEDQDTSGVESAIIRRIMVAHTDLLKQFGPEKVMQAVEEVAYNVGDVDEIGTSDVSAYVNQVRQILGA